MELLVGLDYIHRGMAGQFSDFHCIPVSFLMALIDETEQRALVHQYS